MIYSAEITFSFEAKTIEEAGDKFYEALVALDKLGYEPDGIVTRQDEDE